MNRKKVALVFLGFLLGYASSTLVTYVSSQVSALLPNSGPEAPTVGGGAKASPLESQSEIHLSTEIAKVEKELYPTGDKEAPVSKSDPVDPGPETDASALAKLQENHGVQAKKILPGEPEMTDSPGAVTKATLIDEKALNFALVKAEIPVSMKEFTGRIEDSGRPELLMEKLGSSNPALIPIDLQVLQQNFLSPLAHRTFTGQVQALKKSSRILFLSISDNETALKTLIQDVGGAIYENRLLPTQKPSLAWRQPTHGQGIVTVQNRCPWNGSYTQEMKQFFYLTISDQVGVRLFCKNVSDNTWSELGWAVLAPAS